MKWAISDLLLLTAETLKQLVWHHFINAKLRYRLTLVISSLLLSRSLAYPVKIRLNGSKIGWDSKGRIPRYTAGYTFKSPAGPPVLPLKVWIWVSIFSEHQIENSIQKVCTSLHFLSLFLLFPFICDGKESLCCGGNLVSWLNDFQVSVRQLGFCLTGHVDKGKRECCTESSLNLKMNFRERSRSQATQVQYLFSVGWQFATKF